MFNWEKLESLGITKSDRHLVSSEDNIHCITCREHIGDHGIKDGTLLHPLDIANLLNPDKE